MVAQRFQIKAVGVSFHDRYPDNLYELRERFAHGKGEASLLREPDNQYDANAVAVFAGGEIVGHLPAWFAAKLAPELDSGTRYRVTDAVTLIDPDYEDRPGLLLECERV